MAISVKLEKFEGPLDLLLHLIEKNKIDIYDIPIVEITEQYLDYVKQMQDLSSVILEIAKEGNCVIMGRGAFLFLHELPNHITLRFVAPMEDRVKHLMELKNSTGCGRRSPYGRQIDSLHFYGSECSSAGRSFPLMCDSSLSDCAHFCAQRAE